MEKTISKVMFVSFVGGAVLVGYSAQVLNTLFANWSGAYRSVMGAELTNNLVPVALGLVFLIFAYSSKSVKNWAHEVIVEVSKVVWPSKKDTTAMTIFVCIFMILSGVLLGVFDYFSGMVIRQIIEWS